MAMAIFAAVPGWAQDNKEVKIGLISTFSGPSAAVAADQKNGWDLGVEHLGGKLGGLTVKTLYGDDQARPEVAIGVVDKWLQQDKIDFVVGTLGSNVLLAIKDRIFQAGKLLINANAGASPIAGEECHPQHFSTSWNNESWSEAAGQMANNAGIKKVFVLVPNYQGGKDMVAGFKRSFKGEIVGEIFFKFNTIDFQSEFSEVRAKQPDAVFMFAPGGMGIAFFKQFSALGLNKTIKLYSVSTIDYIILNAIGEAALGSYFPSPFNHESKSPVAAKFVADYVAKHKKVPSNYAAQSYDAALVLNHGIGAVKGDLTKTKEMIQAIRGMKIEWTRGNVVFNTNHIPIQNWYTQTVVLKDGKPEIKTEHLVYEMRKDFYSAQCKMPY